MAGKGSTLISTGKVNKPKPTAPAPVAPAAPAPPSLPVAKPMVPHQGARIVKATPMEESALSPIKVGYSVHRRWYMCLCLQS